MGISRHLAISFNSDSEGYNAIIKRLPMHLDASKFLISIYDLFGLTV